MDGSGPEGGLWELYSLWHCIVIARQSNYEDCLFNQLAKYWHWVKFVLYMSSLHHFRKPDSAFLHTTDFQIKQLAWWDEKYVN